MRDRREVPVRWALRLSIASIVLVFAHACSGSSKPDTTNLDGVDPSTFYSITGGKAGAVTERQWTDIIADWKKHGLSQMSDDTRRQIIAESLGAYLLSTREAEFEIAVEDGQGGTKRAHVVDTYADGLLTARSVTSDGVSAKYASFPALLPNAPQELRIVHDGRTHAFHIWTKLDDGWHCQLDPLGGLGASELDRLVIVGTLPATGVLGVVSTINGRKATLVTVAGENGRPGLVYWLDAKTLWPVRIDVKATAHIPASSTTLVRVNGDTQIVDPGDPDTCAPYVRSQHASGVGLLR